MSDTQKKEEKQTNSSDKESVIRSKQMAETLKSGWKDLQSKQEASGRKLSAGERIRNVSLRKNHRGEVSVKVSTEDGAELRKGNQSTLSTFKEKSLEVTRRMRIEAFLQKVKRYGWKAVEGEIPSELKEHVLKACEKANVSVSEKTEAEKAKMQAELAGKMLFPKEKEAQAPVNKTPDLDPRIIPIPLDETLSERRKKELLEKAKLAVETALKTADRVSFADEVTIKTIQQTREDTQSVTVKTVIDGAEIKTSGDEPLANILKLQEAATLLEKKEKGEALSQEEEKRLELWAKKGVTTLEELKANGGKFAGQISGKGMTGEFAEKMKEAKQATKEDKEKEALNPNNKETALKMDQMKFVLEKNEQGLELSKQEENLLQFVNVHAKDSSEFSKLPDSKLAELVACKGRFLKDDEGSCFDISKQRQALAENPELYQAKEIAGEFGKPAEKKEVVLNVNVGMSLEELKQQKRARKGDAFVSKDSAIKADLLNLYGKMHGLEVVDEKGLAWAEENIAIAPALFKERGQMSKQAKQEGKAFSQEEWQARIDTVAQEAKKNPEAFMPKKKAKKVEKAPEQTTQKEGVSTPKKEAQVSEVFNKIKSNKEAHRASVQKETNSEKKEVTSEAPVKKQSLQSKISSQKASQKQNGTEKKAPLSAAEMVEIKRRGQGLSL